MLSSVVVYPSANLPGLCLFSVTAVILNLSLEIPDTRQRSFLTVFLPTFKRSNNNPPLNMTSHFQRYILQTANHPGKTEFTHLSIFERARHALIVRRITLILQLKHKNRTAGVRHRTRRCELHLM